MKYTPNRLTIFQEDGMNNFVGIIKYNSTRILAHGVDLRLEESLALGYEDNGKYHVYTFHRGQLSKLFSFSNKERVFYAHQD